MTDAAIIAASYAAERNYSHNPDDVIDASDAVGAWGTAKESTTELVDLSGNGNIADIHGAMPTEGFIQGRRYDGINDYLDCGNDSSLDISNDIIIEVIGMFKTLAVNQRLTEKGGWGTGGYRVYKPGNTSELGWDIRTTTERHVISSSEIGLNKIFHGILTYTTGSQSLYLNGELVAEYALTGNIKPAPTNFFIGNNPTNEGLDGEIYYIGVYILNNMDIQRRFNALARLPFWSVNYTDYPDNVTEYTDNLPYSSSIINSGTFKVDDDVLNCVSAGTMTYSASYDFDGSEYIKVEIGGVEYAGTGTITQGNTTVSVAQGSNKITIVMGTADTIDGIDIQFREEV